MTIHCASLVETKDACQELCLIPNSLLKRKMDDRFFGPKGILFCCTWLTRSTTAHWRLLPIKRFPGGKAARWTVRQGDVPRGSEALLLLTVEELAVNELRETFHHWVRTFEIPVANGELGPEFPHRPATKQRGQAGPITREAMEQARLIWNQIERDVREFVDQQGKELTDSLLRVLKEEYEQARQNEIERFQRRHGEVSTLIEQQTLVKLEREIATLQMEQKQGVLFDSEGRLEALARSEAMKQEELARRRSHYEELRRQLTKERDRVIDHLLPKRYEMRGAAAQVFPVAIELRLPQDQG